MISPRRVAANAAAVMVVCALTGCSPRSAGTVGVGIDKAGRPVGYVRVCQGDQMDSAALYDQTHPESAALAHWHAEPAVSGSSSWSLQNPGRVWTIDRTLSGLQPGTVYALRAGTSDGPDPVTGGDVLFTLSDLSRMSPDQVRVYDVARARAAPYADPTGGSAQQARDDNSFMHVITRAEFEQNDCLQP